MTVHQRIGRALAAGAGSLDEAAGKDILASYGIAVPRNRTVSDAAGLREAAAALTPPFALKIVSATILHKSDVGGVRLGLRDADEAVAAQEAMAAALADRGLAADAWLLEEMVPPGVELVVGGLNDPQFGPMVMAGLGGIFIEVMKDVAFRICPITRRDAAEMLEELQGAPLLRGARGRPPVDMAAVVDALMRIGGPDGLLMHHAGALSELDINPLIATPQGAFAADARFILRPADDSGKA